MKNNEKFTEKAESAIEQARLAAYSLGHSYVGTEHLLIGIVHEGAGLGARILRERGVSERRLAEGPPAAVECQNEHPPQRDEGFGPIQP